MNEPLDPFVTLGIDRSASADEVRRARRELARTAHPDAGGSSSEMQSINAAAASALRSLVENDAKKDSGSDSEHTNSSGATDWAGGRRDIPSFTVEALPVETFEALLVAAGELGEVADEDPPYELVVLMDVPTPCWCQLDVVPDAGSSTVSLTIAPVEGQALVGIERVRDAWITALNRLDWDF